MIGRGNLLSFKFRHIFLWRRSYFYYQRVYRTKKNTSDYQAPYIPTLNDGVLQHLFINRIKMKKAYRLDFE